MQNTKNQAKYFRNNPENGIQISDFKIDSSNDCELMKLVPFLRFLNSVKDVRHVGKYLSDFVQGKEIRYIDVNEMENVYQRGVFFEDDRLETELSESKMDRCDFQFKEEQDCYQEHGNTIHLEAEEHENQDHNSDQNEEDIETGIQKQNRVQLRKIKQSINRFFPNKNVKDQQEEHIYNKIDYLEKDSLVHHKFQSLDSYVNEELSHDQPLQISSKDIFDHVQTSINADNSENFIQKPKIYKKPSKRRCVSSVLHLAETQICNDNFHSPNAKQF